MIKFEFENGSISDYNIVKTDTEGGFPLPVCRICGNKMVVDKLKTDRCQLVCECGCFDEAFMFYATGKYTYYYDLEKVKKWEDERWEVLLCLGLK